MENIFYTLLGALITFFGYNYFQRKGAEKVEKKINKRKNEIASMSTAQLVAFANSILAARRGNSGK